jgi:hypothetical protein
MKELNKGLSKSTQIFRTVVCCMTAIILLACTGKEAVNIKMDNVYPWCIVAFDSFERSPIERINMLGELGFSKYAYDWRDSHLDEMESELQMAKDHDIEVISVWLWLNAKRDSLGRLSPSNDKIFEIIEKLQLKTTLWLSFSNNFFEDLTQEESMTLSTDMIKYVYSKAQNIGCDIALYNHHGWFGDLNNQVEIIRALPELDLRIVYNFHHAHEYLDELPEIIKKIKPFLSAVNLNGMRKEGPKILPIGLGNQELVMIRMFMDAGFKGPWGILGHVENEDVKIVLERNLKGLHALDIERSYK